MSSRSTELRKTKTRKTWTRDELLSHITEISNGRKTGASLRRHHSNMLKTLGPVSLSRVLDQAGINEAEVLEGYIISQIQTIRKDASQPGVKISEHLRQLGKAQSQYFCGNCLRAHNEVQNPTLSFSMKRNEHDSLKTCAKKMAAYWKIAEKTDVLAYASLKEIGVGVWGTSQTMVVTIVTTTH